MSPALTLALLLSGFTATLVVGCVLALVAETYGRQARRRPNRSQLGPAPLRASSAPNRSLFPLARNIQRTHPVLNFSRADIRKRWD